ncbi:MAG: hypothetical protein ABIR18_16280 [Chitinophagaceae bacterium]
MSTTKNTLKPQLIVEKSDGLFWGRVKIKGNLIVDSASNLERLKKKMKVLIFDFEDQEVISFDISYDLTSFFEQYPFVNIAEIANKSGINYSLMRQYSIGYKFPSSERVGKIEDAIREIGKELAKIKLHKAGKVVM